MEKNEEKKEILEQTMEDKKKEKQKKEKIFYKKWWFWIILLIMILIIGFTVIILVGFNMINPDKNLTELAKKLKDYDERITVFQSANKRTIAINCNFDNEGEATEKSTEIGKIINNYMDYLGVYKNISIDVYTENGTKTSFTIDIATRKIEL